MEDGVPNQSADGQSQHGADDVVVGGSVAPPHDEQPEERRDADDEHRQRAEPVHCGGNKTRTAWAFTS